MKTFLLLSASVFVLVAARAGAEAPAAPRPVVAANAKFGDAGGMPKGVQSSLVYGDPKVGPYLVLLKIPAGTTLMPHFHSSAEVTTVVSGTLLFGGGEKIDESKATELGPGGYVEVPAKSPHWAKAKTDVLTVRFAPGAGDVIYVDPKDDPRKK